MNMRYNENKFWILCVFFIAICLVSSCTKESSSPSESLQKPESVTNADDVNAPATNPPPTPESVTSTEAANVPAADSLQKTEVNNNNSAENEIIPGLPNDVLERVANGEGSEEDLNNAIKAFCDGPYLFDTCITPGTIISFGQYLQSDETVKEPLRWRVLEIDKTNKKILLLSSFILEGKPYHSQNTDITWADSTLRAWLNNDFINTAFNPSEQAQILLTSLKNLANPDTGIEGGKDTEDKIFLLSLEDAKNKAYFSNQDARMGTLTKHALKSAFHTEDDCFHFDCTEEEEKAAISTDGQWWLRSPGYKADRAAKIYYNGEITSDYAYTTGIGIRPAMWIKY